MELKSLEGEMKKTGAYLSAVIEPPNLLEDSVGQVRGLCVEVPGENDQVRVT